MPPKPRYSKEAVLDAALAVAREHGLGAVSARSVAKALSSSTAPVSSYFDSMQALVEAVVARIVQELLAYVDAADGPDPLRAGAFAFVRFATHEPNLYEGLFLTPHASPPDWVALRRRFAQDLGDSERFGALSARARDAVAWRATVITHGICIEIWSGRWTKTDDASLRRLVDDLVEPVIASFLRERG